MKNFKMTDYDKNHLSWSEQYRHQCETRYVLAIRATNRDEAMKYLSMVQEKRKEKAKKLIDDCKKQWELGNRGQWGDWRD
jgi:hypothetical protein